MTRAALLLLVGLGLGACGAWCVRVKGAAFGARASVTVCSDNRRDVEHAARLLDPVDGGTDAGGDR